MNKADLIEAVAIKCDISKLAAQRAVDACLLYTSDAADD